MADPPSGRYFQWPSELLNFSEILSSDSSGGWNSYVTATAGDRSVVSGKWMCRYTSQEFKEPFPLGNQAKVWFHRKLSFTIRQEMSDFSVLENLAGTCCNHSQNTGAHANDQALTKNELSII